MKKLASMHKSVLLTMAFLLACPLAVSAQSALSAKGVTLRLKFTPGQTWRYKVTMTMHGVMVTAPSGGAGTPLNFAMTLTMKQTVKKVRAADGAATIETEFEDAQQAQMKQPITIVMLPTGKVLSVDMSSQPAGGIPGLDISKSFLSSNIALPDAAVKVGDTWNGEAVMGIASAKMLVVSTLTSLETKDAAQLATIDQKITGSIDTTTSQNLPMPINMAGTVTGSGTQVFDVTTGAISSQTTTTNTSIFLTFGPAAGQAPPVGSSEELQMHLNMHQTLVMQLLDETAPASAVP